MANIEQKNKIVKQGICGFESYPPNKGYNEENTLSCDGGGTSDGGWG